MHREPKLLKLAKGKPCVMCYRDDGTVVAAHSNLLEHGKGMAMKAHDCMTAWLCMTCHSMVDQGKHLTKEEKRMFMLEAICKTHIQMWEQGLLQVKGIK
jgi:ferredoxin